jgi:hypothetical protein
MPRQHERCRSTTCGVLTVTLSGMRQVRGDWPPGALAVTHWCVTARGLRGEVSRAPMTAKTGESVILRFSSSSRSITNSVSQNIPEQALMSLSSIRELQPLGHVLSLHSHLKLNIPIKTGCRFSRSVRCKYEKGCSDAEYSSFACSPSHCEVGTTGGLTTDALPANSRASVLNFEAACCLKSEPRKKQALLG